MKRADEAMASMVRESLSATEARRDKAELAGLTDLAETLDRRASQLRQILSRRTGE